MLIGDSISDINAGIAAGVRTIAYVNKAGQVERLSHADALITDLRPLARLLRRGESSSGH